MQAFHVDLKEFYPLQGGKLSCMLADCPWDENPQAWKRPAVIVVPGGDYVFVSRREGEPVASYFLSRGFQAFILTYDTATEGVHYPQELLQLASAVDYVRKHAGQLHVNPEEVFVVGFSAGGHLTANLAVDYARARGLDCRPTAVGLSYPVISAKAGYPGSHKNLLAGCPEEEKAELTQRLDLDEQVTENTPPAFIWTTAEDDLVPSVNALRYALALAQKGIRYELHVYPQGGHGGSTWDLEVNGWLAGEANLRKKNSRWLENCAEFFRLYTKEAF